MTILDRRALLRTLGLAAAASASLPTPAAEAARSALTESEQAGKAIGYVEDAKSVNVSTNPTYKRGQSCATCSFIEFGSGRQRGCTVVPGRLVNAGGWCKVWKLRGSR